MEDQPPTFRVEVRYLYADWPGDMAICVHATAKGVGEAWYLVYETRQVSMLSPYRVGMFRRG